MSLPDDLTYVTVIGQVAEVPEGAARTVTFRSPAWLQGTPFLAPFGVAATVSADGTFTASLPATDDPAFSPINWAYDVTITVGAQREYGTLIVPAATAGSLELGTALVRSAPTDAGEVAYLLASARSVAGGVAALDVDGDVTDAAGNKITGGGGGSGPSASSTVVTETAYGQSSTAGNAATFSRGNHTHGSPALPSLAAIGAASDVHALRHADGGADEVLLDGSQITGGTVAVARLPTGTSGSTVALGNHTHGGGGGGITPTHSRARIISGDLVPPANASMTPISGLTLAIPAATGDNLEFHLSCLIDMAAGATTNFFDLAVLNGSTVVQFSSTGTSSEPGSGEGDPSLYPGLRFQGTVGHWSFAAGANDVVGGNVTIGLCHKGADNSKVYASTVFPLRWSIVNYKQ